MAKIHKSNNILMNKNQPVMLNIPRISQGLRDLVTGESGSANFSTTVNQSDLFEVDVCYEENLRLQAREEADEILNEAKNRAAWILEDARIESVNLLKQAKIEGFNQGMDEVEEMKESHRKVLLTAYKDEVKKQEDKFEKTILAIEEQILDLSLTIAEKVIGFELSRNEEALKMILQDALRQIRIKNGITIKASKNICEKIKTMNNLQVDNIQIVPQEGWTDDSYQIESLLGTLDLGWKNKMDRISQLLCGEIA